MFNSLVFTSERDFEVTFGIFSVLVAQINVTLVMTENVNVMIFSSLKSKFYQYFVLTNNFSNDLSHFLLNFDAGIFQIKPRKPHQLKVF